jgi:hypothetical protein
VAQSRRDTGQGALTPRVAPRSARPEKSRWTINPAATSYHYRYHYLRRLVRAARKEPSAGRGFAGTGARGLEGGNKPDRLGGERAISNTQKAARNTQKAAWKVESEPVDGRDCFGSSRETGHTRVPLPPVTMTRTIVRCSRHWPRSAARQLWRAHSAEARKTRCRSRGKTICGRPLFPRKMSPGDRSLAPICPALNAAAGDRWPRWIPRREFQPVGAVSLRRWTSRSVSRLGSIDRAIFSLPCKLRGSVGRRCVRRF